MMRLFLYATFLSLASSTLTERDQSCRVNTLYYGKVGIVCYKEGESSFLLRDMTRGKGIVTLHGDKEDFRSPDDQWRLDGVDAGALDVHYCVSKAYDFFRTVFGRRSLDDQDCAIYSLVDDPQNPNNARWTGRSLKVGVNGLTGKPLASLDIIGHELTHAIIANTCRLADGGESGAVGESICDIMGKSLEFWVQGRSVDWTIGAEAGFHLRDLGNPHANKQPSAYDDSAYWYIGRHPQVAAHVNSGVGNYMFYLLVNGGRYRLAEHVYRIRGISVTDADRVIYRSFTKYLAPESNYEDWRRACCLAAKEIFGAESRQVRSVENAWAAVGVKGNRDL